MKHIAFLLLACCAFGLAPLAFAQDAGAGFAAPLTAVDPKPDAGNVVMVETPTVVVPNTAPELVQDLQPLLDLAQKPGVGIAVIVVTVLLVFSRLALHFGSKLPGAAGAVFSHPWAAWLLPIVTSSLGALSTAALAGAPVTLGLLGGALLAGLAAAGTGNKQAVIDHAVAKGEIARSGIQDKAAALEAMRKAL